MITKPRLESKERRELRYKIKNILDKTEGFIEYREVKNSNFIRGIYAKVARNDMVAEVIIDRILNWSKKELLMDKKKMWVRKSLAFHIKKAFSKWQDSINEPLEEVKWKFSK